MRWILENFGFFVFVFIALSMLRALRKAMQLTKEHGAASDETEEQRNLRRIQEGIRRKIAERRAGSATDQPPPLLARTVEREPGPPPAVPSLDAFGGPAARTLADRVRRAPSRELPPTSPALTEAAAVARQEELAEQMRMLEEARALARRRAAEIAAARKAESESEAGVLATERGTLLADLREPQSLRRALVLREVLGPPVALR
jgi:hypothetical protein